MANNRKLGKRSDQRNALLYNQAAELLWYGRIETTVERAKEIRKIAEKMITLGVNNYKDTKKVTKKKINQNNQPFDQEFTNDGPKKLAARRAMMACLPDLQYQKVDKESKEAFRNRTADNKHPLIAKIFDVYAPKYDRRKEDKGGIGGGYTRIIRLANRLGDDASQCILELVD